jgi:hypothetical protein
MSAPFEVYFLTGDSGDRARKSQSELMPEDGRARIFGTGKGEQTPASVDLDCVAKKVFWSPTKAHNRAQPGGADHFGF